MPSELAYEPSYGTEVSDQFAVDSAELGDGYEASAPAGINATREVWRLVYDRISLTNANAIRAFLATKVGASFTWTPPGGTEKRFKLLGEVSARRVGPSTCDMSFTLREHFGA